MKSFFSLQENQERLKSEIEKWIGVPYLHMGWNTGGVDCATFVGAVLFNLGILKDFPRAPYYSTDWYLHGVEEICLNGITSAMKKLQKGLLVKKIPFSKQEIEVGDLVCIAKNPKGIVNHTALYLGENKIAHCVQKKGVFVGQFSFSYASLTKYCFRLYYEE